jgi:hypothetical protein
MTTPSLLEQFQLGIGARLDSLPSLMYVPVFVIRPRTAKEAVSVQTEINNSLAGATFKNGKTGATVIVHMPIHHVSDPNLPGPYCDAVGLIRVIENSSTNMSDIGTQLSCETIGESVLQGMHLFNLGISGSEVYAEKDAMAANLNPVFIEQDQVVYDCLVKTFLGLPPIHNALAPHFSYDGTSLTLITNEPGAVTYYTLDSSFPWAGSATNPSTAIQYTVPVAIAAPATIRAASYINGKAGSDVQQFTL